MIFDVSSAGRKVAGRSRCLGGCGFATVIGIRHGVVLVKAGVAGTVVAQIGQDLLKAAWWGQEIAADCH